MTELASLSRSAAALLIERGETLAVSESAAGGLISAAMLSIPGASAYFLGGGVVYTRDARRGLLGMTDDEAKQRGATEEYTLAAARLVRRRLGATWALAESGAAGPGGNSYGDAAGHACIAVSGPVERCRTIGTGESGREANMWAFAHAGIDFLEATLRARGAAVTVYGLGNCDTCRKARKWLDGRGIAHRFHDFAVDGIDAQTLDRWLDEHGADVLVNRRSRTWRELPEAERTTADPASAAAMVLAHPKLIKRPVIEAGGRSLVGFDAAVRAVLEDRQP